ncbi:hypothetical protein [Nonomuraea recticatena]|uniref:Integrase n=1 Tax=Nonomuraea recticatena TaxID=46178 RepID=A0ABN3RME2_9ACTN
MTRRSWRRSSTGGASFRTGHEGVTDTVERASLRTGHKGVTDTFEWASFRTGHKVVTDTVERLTGRPARSPRECEADQEADFR